jgi:hypothetical protein
METMRGAVLVEPYKIEIQDFPKPEVDDDTVIVVVNVHYRIPVPLAQSLAVGSCRNQHVAEHLIDPMTQITHFPHWIPSDKLHE